MANFFDQFDATPESSSRSPYAEAIGNVESRSDGGYRAVGIPVHGGDRALGKYQVMASNVRPWSREILGREVSPQEFMANTQLQDQIFDGKFGQYVKKYGPDGAARAWFAGEKGMNHPGRTDPLGTSVSEYSRRFNRELGFAGQPQPRNDLPPMIATGHSAPQQAAPPSGGNFFDQFDEVPPAQSQTETPLATPSTSGRPRIVIDTNKIGQTPAQVGGDGQDRGALDAGARGVAQGLTANFGDEIRGLVEAGGANPDDPASVYKLLSGALKYFGGDAEAKKHYDEAVARERGLNTAAEQQHPVASTVGGLAGAMALPLGAASQGATLPARMGMGAVTGAALGGASGAGEGTDALDRTSRAITGVGVGGVLGGASPVAIRGIEAAGQGIASLARPVTTNIRGLRNPDAEAARRILLAQERDAKTANPGMSADDFAAAKASGSPVINADRGGETVQALARSAANTSPEGRAALEAVTSDRYATQQPRMASFLKETFDFPEPGATLDRLQEAARRTNRPAYAKAYAQGQSIWDEGLEQYSQAPVVQKAIQLAFVTGRNKAAMDGFPPMKNPFVLNRETGALELKPGVTPNLQFWDHVKRNLDQMGAEGQAFSKALRNHLDEIVPSYAEARAGAAKFFGAEDALEAGAKFATMGGRDAISLSEARKGLAAMSPEERKLFQTGFVSNLIAKVESLRDGQDVVKNIFNSEVARTQIRLALGEEKASQLEAKLLTERAMNGVKNAIQGNSTTARQWIERTLAGGATGVGGIGAYETDPKKLTAAALTGALVAGSRRIDQRVARRVAEMLASDNPEILKAGERLIQKSTALRDAFRRLDLPSARVGGEQAPAVPVLQAAGVSRADDDPNLPRPTGQ